MAAVRGGGCAVPAAKGEFSMQTALRDPRLTPSLRMPPLAFLSLSPGTTGGHRSTLAILRLCRALGSYSATPCSTGQLGLEPR